jgi:hypothetical protein
MLSPAMMLIKPVMLSHPMKWPLAMLAEVVKARIVANAFLETDLEN